MGPQETNFLWSSDPNSNFFIEKKNAFENIVCEKFAILSGPQLVNDAYP